MSDELFLVSKERGYHDDNKVKGEIVRLEMRWWIQMSSCYHISGHSMYSVHIYITRRKPYDQDLSVFLSRIGKCHSTPYLVIAPPVRHWVTSLRSRRGTANREREKERKEAHSAMPRIFPRIPFSGDTPKNADKLMYLKDGLLYLQRSIQLFCVSTPVIDVSGQMPRASRLSLFGFFGR